MLRVILAMYVGMAIVVSPFTWAHYGQHGVGAWLLMTALWPIVVLRIVVEMASAIWRGAGSIV